MMTLKTRGVTFIELLLALAVLGVLLILCTSSISNLFTQQQIKGQTQRLFHTLQYARAEAIKQNRQIMVCPTLDFIRCADDWSKGYMVFNSEKILLVQQNMHPIPIKTSVTRIIYRGDGRAFNRGTFQLGMGTQQYRIVIYDSGRSRIEAPAIERA